MSRAEEAREGMVSASDGLTSVTAIFAQLHYVVDGALATGTISVGGTDAEREVQEVASILHSEIDALLEKFEVGANKYLEISRRFM